MDVGVPMAGSPQSTSFDKLLWTTEMDALKLDPNWKGGEGTGPMTPGIRSLQRDRLDERDIARPAGCRNRPKGL
jgi:homoserine acetyltransferase